MTPKKKELAMIAILLVGLCLSVTAAFLRETTIAPYFSQAAIACYLVGVIGYVASRAHANKAQSTKAAEEKAAETVESAPKTE